MLSSTSLEVSVPECGLSWMTRQYFVGFLLSDPETMPVLSHLDLPWNVCSFVQFYSVITYDECRSGEHLHVDVLIDLAQVPRYL